jgi:hypothetical protein
MDFFHRARSSYSQSVATSLQNKRCSSIRPLIQIPVEPDGPSNDGYCYSSADGKSPQRDIEEDDDDDDDAVAAAAEMREINTIQINEKRQRQQRNDASCVRDGADDDGGYVDASLGRILNQPGVDCNYDDRQVEAMEISITIYSLKGLYRRNRSKNKSSLLSSATKRSRRKQQNQSTGGGSTKLSSSMDGGATVNIPTTAVVSASQYISKSGLAVQTHVPSLEIKLHEDPNSSTQTSLNSSDNSQEVVSESLHRPVRCGAYWRDDLVEDAIVMDRNANRDAFWKSFDSNANNTTDAATEQNPLCSATATIRLSRLMQRETYNSNKGRIQQVSHYVHERIDLQVGVARGKELVPLGIASIAVSGEEEQQVITNVPVKSLFPNMDETVTFYCPAGTNPSNSGRSFPKFTSKSRKMKKSGDKRKDHFRHDPYAYSLAENATLRVGIRVLPQKYREEQQQQQLQELTMVNQGTTKELFRPNGEIYFELEDENSLIAQLEYEQREMEFLRKFLASSPRPYESPSSETDKNTSNSESPATATTATSPFFFCGFNLCPCMAGTAIDPNTSPTSTQQVAREERKRLELQRHRAMTTSPRALQATKSRVVPTASAIIKPSTTKNALMRSSPHLLRSRIVHPHVLSDVSDSTSFGSDEDETEEEETEDETEQQQKINGNNNKNSSNNKLQNSNDQNSNKLLTI